MATCASDNQLIIKKLHLLNEEGLVRHSNKLDLDHCGKFFPQIITQKLQRDILVNRRGEVNVYVTFPLRVKVNIIVVKLKTC